MGRYQKLFFCLAAGLALGAFISSGRISAAPQKTRKLLYMTLSKGYHHQSVEPSGPILKQIGEKSGAFSC